LSAGIRAAVIVLILLASGTFYLYYFDYTPFKFASSATSIKSSVSSTSTSEQCAPVAVVPTAHTLRVPSDYSSISAAITASSKGDVVQVLPGNYSGFTIDRPTKVIACTPKTIINGAVVVDTNGSTISGFEIDGSARITIQLAGSNVGKSPPNSTIILAHGVANNTVSNNLLLNTRPNTTALFGVTVFSGKSNRISNNTEIGFNSGVVLDSISRTDYSYKNLISWNRISMPSFRFGNLSGIVDLASYSMILDNNISTCFQGVVLFGFNATVSGNTVKDCLTGISATRLSIGPSTDNHIFENNLIGNYLQASDNGANNTWYKGQVGNYWSDWKTGRGPRLINGSAGTFDEYPLVAPFIPQRP
jgi:nitrous oxidase accessory protein NosD